jgi:LysM repeat protein
MQRLEFAYSNTKAGKEYLKYLFKVSDNERIIFDIGVASDVALSVVEPMNAILLNAPNWQKLNDTLKEAIFLGNQPIRLFIPLRLKQYSMATVYSIEWMNKQDNKYISRNIDMSFILDMDKEELFTASDNLLQKVGENKTGNCKTYLLRKNSSMIPTLYTDLTWSPDLGVIKETYSGNQGEYTLLRIQGVPLVEYMANQCHQELTIHENTEKTAALRAKGNDLLPAEEKIHIVEKGETLFGIAKKYQILPGDLMDYNPTIDPNKLNIGKPIKIPAKKALIPNPEGTYVLKEGDNIEKISMLFGITHQVIKQWNPSFDTKVIGDLIFIKEPINNLHQEGVRTKGVDLAVVGKPNTAVKANWWETTNGKHIVKADETISMLATAYGFTEERFRQMNGLLPHDNIKEGQQLITVVCPLPISTTPVIKPTAENIHSPKASNDLENSATERKAEENIPYFDIQDGKMKSLFTEPEILSPDIERQQTIKGSSSKREIYIVQQGDTLSGIAIKFNLTEIKLRELNKLSPGEAVIPRQRLFLN